MKAPSYVYIMTNSRYGTLYIGSTTDLVRRVWIHREGLQEGFTKKYRLRTLVWYEVHPDLPSAGLREKKIKHWHRSWKVKLVSEFNPTWRDLYPEISS